MDFKRLSRIYYTLRRLKFIQVNYQLYYRINRKLRKKQYNHSAPESHLLSFSEGIDAQTSYSENTFTFLNLSKRFDDIDWNFAEYGKLWTYNFNYFDFLRQEGLGKEKGIQLMRDFCSKKILLKDAYEPYPISLRGMNWISFLSRHEIKDEVVCRQLYNDYRRLMDQREYHILGNHLFENGFSLLFGAYFFRDEAFYKAAKQILRQELKEEILPDGAHYELSTMYHQIILHRILDCYNLVSNNNWKNGELGRELKNAASSMLGWMKTMQFANGDVALVNDSATGIAAAPEQLLDYAERLGIAPEVKPLKESGYRKLISAGFEVLADAGQISPSYQPGHSHADTLQFLVYADQRPLIVDTGISTYEKNAIRQLERSTSAHNTVTVNGIDSSDVWSGFRVGKRAIALIHEDMADKLIASHNGYRSFGIRHERIFAMRDEQLVVEDILHGAKSIHRQEGHLHFHPDVSLSVNEQEVIVNDKYRLRFYGVSGMEIKDYAFCQGYNKRVPARKLVYSFESKVRFELTKLHH